MIAVTPAPSNSFASSTAASSEASRPAFDGDLSASRVDADGDPVGKEPAGLPDEVGIAHGHGSEDHARETLLQPFLDVGQRTDATTELHRVLCRLEDRLDGRTVDAFAGKGAVQVHDVQPFEALILEGSGLCGGVGVVDGGLVHVTELETHALTVLEIDCREKDHGFHLRKLPIRARPRVWLFSGWNWVPAMLSRATAAVTGPP